ncbi:MAG: DNA polymerase III subunit beta, partial [Thermoanaerobaculia bacterium]
MEIRVQRAEFLDELAPMQGIVERRTTIPILSHILLRAQDDRLHLAATDLDVSLTSWSNADVEGSGGIAVQARKFLEIIRALVGDEVRLTLEDGKRLIIEAGRSRFKINGLSPEDFPTLPDVRGETATEIPFRQLKRMISKVIFAVSTEESRFQLNGALLKLKEGAMELVATDGHRLALVENPLDSASGNAEGVLIPRKALQE